MIRRIDKIAQCFDAVDELTRERGLVTSEMVPSVLSPDGDQDGPPQGHRRYWDSSGHVFLVGRNEVTVGLSVWQCALATNRVSAQRFWTPHGLVEIEGIYAEAQKHPWDW